MLVKWRAVAGRGVGTYEYGGRGQGYNSIGYCETKTSGLSFFLKLLTSCNYLRQHSKNINYVIGIVHNSQLRRPLELWRNHLGNADT